MSETKQTGKRKKTAVKSGKSKARQPKKQETGIGDEIALVVLLVFAGFLFISNFGFGGAVGDVVSEVLFGCFGLLAYVLPVLMLVLILFHLANKDSLLAKLRIAGLVLGCLDCMAWLHILIREKTSAYKNIYEYCKANHLSGGLTGGVLGEVLCKVFGVAGACLILAGILIICMVMITGKSFVKVMSNGSQKAYESARDDMVRRRKVSEERKEQKKEQREQQRLEKRVSGVGVDLLIPKTEGNGLQEVEAVSEELPVSPEHAKMPAETVIGEDFTFPVQEAEAQKSGSRTNSLKEIFLAEEEPAEEPEGTKEFEQKESLPTETSVEKAEETQEDKPEEFRMEPVSGEEVQDYQLPPVTLLRAPDRKGSQKDAKSGLQETAALLQQTLQDFGVNATVTNASRGPAVTRYEVQPAHGVKVSKIVALADDIKLNLAVADIRIEAPIPGKAAVGIEVPNKENTAVSFRELVESEEFQKLPSKISFAVGKDIGGKIMVTDIAKMPHLLIAGATGSGKSVCINTLIMSILYKARPDEVKMIMIDPKVVELSGYNGIPHLLIPVVTDPKKAAGALSWAVAEMMGRYNRFAEVNVKNIEGYNAKVESLAGIDDENKPKKMEQIVIVVDELADLMMVSPGEVEDSICRLAQLARAAGIHLIIATQRPSVNVITGLIKANMTSRIAFAVSSGVDSRTILDMNGAEKLLGKGDMLFYPAGLPKPLRVQGAFVSETEVGAVVEFLSRQKCGSSESQEQMEASIKQAQNALGSAVQETGGSERDVLFAEAGKFIIEKEKGSISMLQRWFKIGFNRAARIMDQLADAGVVGEEDGTKARKILMSLEQFEQYLEEYY